MKERLLHFIWQHKLFNTRELHTVQGEPITMLDFGTYNRHGGPDFLQARIRLGDIVLAGSVELHVLASDWKAHGHQHDKSYNNVILHVVFINDLADGHLPTLELNGRIPPLLLDRYHQMMEDADFMLCKHTLPSLDICTMTNWKERLIIERLERKAAEILAHHQANNGDWEQTCYQLLGKYFGASVNQEAFELLTQRLDYKILLKHADRPEQQEALLFGMAGLLNKDFVDPYPRLLKQEFRFLQQKYSLVPLREQLWQFMRIRPISFPTIRLAWLASLLPQFPLTQQLLSQPDAVGWLENMGVSDYWKSHYLPDKASKFQEKKPGTAFKNILFINVVVPLLYAYGIYTDDIERKQAAIELLYSRPPEENNKVHIFPKEVWQAETALDTQSMLELQQQYCAKKRCLECTVGHHILREPEMINTFCFQEIV